MRLSIFLFFVAVLACIETIPCSTWRVRMQKYSALLGCAEYYSATDKIFQEYFPLEETEKPLQLNASNETKNYLRILHFYIIGRNEIKFRLSENQSIDSSDGVLRFIIGDKSYINHAYEEANLRVMHTPNVVRKDEPNEIVLEILNDGKLKLYVNELLIWNTQDGINIRAMKYLSFATAIDGELQELFYKCDSQ